MAKAFAWAYSKMKNFDTCPKRHYEVDLVKNYTESSEALTWGNQVHEALAAAATGNAPLPDSMKEYQKWIDGPGTGIVTSTGTLLVEQKMAITKDFQPTPWFAGNVWFRGVCDVARFDGPVAIARDYKTGKMGHDNIQLMLMASCLFAHHPQIRRIKTEFVWLKDDCVTADHWNRSTIMQEWTVNRIFDKVKEMEQAALHMNYPPKPSRLCARFCPVTSCPFQGKAHT